MNCCLYLSFSCIFVLSVCLSVCHSSPSVVLPSPIIFALVLTDFFEGACLGLFSADISDVQIKDVNVK